MCRVLARAVRGLANTDSSQRRIAKEFRVLDLALLRPCTGTFRCTTKIQNARARHGGLPLQAGAQPVSQPPTPYAFIAFKLLASRKKAAAKLSKLPRVSASCATSAWARSSSAVVRYGSPAAIPDRPPCLSDFEVSSYRTVSDSEPVVEQCPLTNRLSAMFGPCSSISVRVYC